MAPNLTFDLFDFSDAPQSPAVPELQLDTVHIWRRGLAVGSSTLECAASLLSEEEHERASRYRVELARNAFILTRSTLRVLLGAYLCQSPRSIRFGLTRYGKPFLDAGSDLDFNVSHTEGLAELAFVRERRIGIDVERIRSQPDALQLARRFFSEREQQQLESLPADKLTAAFLRCWTRKEAYIKARGEGLSLPLNQFDVSVEANPRRILVATRPDPDEAQRWLLRDVPVPSHYVSAVGVSAVEESTSTSRT
jgi:4'-phosphopantetheinyl transferase